LVFHDADNLTQLRLLFLMALDDGGGEFLRQKTAPTLRLVKAALVVTGLRLGLRNGLDDHAIQRGDLLIVLAQQVEPTGTFRADVVFELLHPAE
jgi:hypothetical protein